MATQTAPGVSSGDNAPAAAVAATDPPPPPPPQQQQHQSRGQMVDTSVSRLQELGINLLALDFDQTIVDVHTYGKWDGTAQELAKHVRSEFRQLMNACCERNIRLAIVTFSVQVKLVKEVVENVVGPDHAARIPVRGADRSWSYRGVGSQEKKQPFIASAVEELEQSGEVEITKSTTVLIDDDRRNVRVALQDGVRAIWFNPDKPHHLLRDLSRLV